MAVVEEVLKRLRSLVGMVPSRPRNENPNTVEAVRPEVQKSPPVALLWMGQSGENETAFAVLADAGVQFVPIPVTNRSEPELVVGQRSFYGLEQIETFVSQVRSRTA